MLRKAPWGSKREGCHPIIGVVKPPTGPHAGIHLGGKLHRQMGEDTSTGQLWEKKQDNWPKVNKDPEEPPYINDLTASLLHPSFRMPTPFLSMCVFLPCF